jgi:hypothetical protein
VYTLAVTVDVGQPKASLSNSSDYIIMQFGHFTQLTQEPRCLKTRSQRPTSTGYSNLNMSRARRSHQLRRNCELHVTAASSPRSNAPRSPSASVVPILGSCATTVPRRESANVELLAKNLEAEQEGRKMDSIMAPTAPPRTLSRSPALKQESTPR